METTRNLKLKLNLHVVSLSLWLQVKQQKLSENHVAVNETINVGRGFISETERTVADVNVLVQVRPVKCSEP